MGTRYLYLEDAPASFKESCDLLNSDDETELPAHSQILARHSSLFADMLVDGPLSRASPLNKACLPLTDCAADTATKMITTLYAAPRQPTPHIDVRSSLPIAVLAHKLDMTVFIHVQDGSSWIIQVSTVAGSSS